MQIDLSGKVALVTGVARQLGRVIALPLAQCGADIAVHYHHSRDKAVEAAAAIRALGIPGIVVTCAVKQYKWVSVLAGFITAVYLPVCSGYVMPAI